MAFPLLQTKLYIPLPRPQVVARPAITTKLQLGVALPLTLVAAPAGFGKTTLVSEWITRSNQPVAWLSLDDEDNDPARFFLYLVAALRSVHPHIGETTLASLQMGQFPVITALLTPLLNELHQLTVPMVLVLDDYHLITATPIHEALTFLVQHLPPTLRLIITTRLDPPLPLARWRVRGQLAEIRADDLRFDATEAATFFNQVMGLHLKPADIDLLETRTEGWIAGLQLAALSMQGRTDIAGFIQSFSGSHRHVFTYLIEEVLNRRPAGTLDFLLQTAILERFNADLCNAVTGLSDSQALLEKLEQANLFLIPLDDERKWYRYHHLFAEVLREHLQQANPRSIPTLYQSAAAWFETQALWPEAIHHALAAADFTRTAHLIERVGIALFSQPNIQHSLQRWLSALPAPFIRARPRLCLMYAWICFAHANNTTALQWVTHAEATLFDHSMELPDATRADEIAAEALAMRTVLAGYNVNIAPTEVLGYGRQAQAMLSENQYSFRGMTASGMGMAYLKLGNVMEAEKAMAEANRMSRAAGNFYMQVAFAASQVLMQRARGSWRRALETCHENLAWLSQHGAAVYPTLGSLYLTLADLLREQNELDRARHYAETAIAHSDQELSPTVSIFSRLALMRVKQAQGDWPQVWLLMDEVVSLTQQHPNMLHSTILPAITAQFRLAENVVAVETLWAKLQNTAWEEGPLLAAYRFVDFVYLYEHSRLARAQVAIAWARQTNDKRLLQETLAYLQRQAQMATESHLGWYWLKVQLLQALAQQTLGQIEEACATLGAGLARAEAEGYVRIFVDEGEPMRLLLTVWAQRALDDLRFTTDDRRLMRYTDKVLAAFAQPVAGQNAVEILSQGETVAQTTINRQPFTAVQGKPSSANLVETLSEREREILQLVANGLSNSQLADKLIVTVGTIKKHLNNIYGKLGVASRTQAIARGRELGLLAD